ncbi:MAG: hypothetical protein AAFV19_02235 [Pseudomonadota bacterium]
MLKCLVAVSIAVGALLVSPIQADAKSPCTSMKNGYLSVQDHGPGKRQRGYVCFRIATPDKNQAVLTLRTATRGGDWDILVGERFDHTTRKMRGTISPKNNRGTADEVVVLPTGSRRTYDVVIFPRTSTPSRACIYYHGFDQSDVAAEAFGLATAQYLLTAIFSGPNDTAAQRRNTGRAVTVGMSALRSRNLGETGYDFAMNEISSELANTFGGGSWLFTFGVNYFAGYLENIGAFSFKAGPKCRS